MRSRVGICLLNDKSGGAEQFLKMLALFYLNNAFLVDVYFLTKPVNGFWTEVVEHRNCSVYSQETSNIPIGFVKTFQLFKTNKSICYQYFFSSHIHTNGLLGLLRRLGYLKASYLIGRESTSIFKRFSGIKLFLFKQAYYFGYPYLDMLICQSELMKQQLQDNLPQRVLQNLTMAVIDNPVDIDNMNKLGSHNIEIINAPYIVSAGRLIKEKGFDVLLESFSKLVLKYPKLKLIIMGDGPLRTDLEDQIESLGLKSNVLLLGFVNNVYPYFKYAKICVVSSRVEGFPNVLLQMMSQNNNVVSTLCAGGVNLLKGVQTVSIENSDDLYKALLNSMELNVNMNRAYYDEELNRRSINNFAEKISSKLSSAHEN